MTDLARACIRRNNILDQVLALKEYTPFSLEWYALNTFMITGHQEKELPMALRNAQAEVWRLIGEYD